jgi:hypothetical protein
VVRAGTEALATVGEGDGSCSRRSAEVPANRGAVRPLPSQLERRSRGCRRPGRPRNPGVSEVARTGSDLTYRVLSMTMTEAVRDLYRAHWGEPTRTARFETGDLAIEVLKWDANASSEGVALYATAGASNWPVDGRRPAHRTEFFVGLLPARDEIASPLAALGLYSVREGVPLDHGHTVPSGRPIWPGSPMELFLVMRPRSDFLPPLELPDRLHVEFLQAIPISRSELEFKREFGADALVREWEDAEIAFWSSERSPHAPSAPGSSPVA